MAEIVPLQLDDSEFNLFLEVPGGVHPDTTPPPQRQAEAYFLSSANEFFRHAAGCGFVAIRDGQPVGRLFASLDDNLAQPEGQRVGHVGYFVCGDDAGCAKALFNAAEEWLGARGVTHVHGPMNLNIYTGYRLQMTGFDSAPFPGEPRNLEYYPALMQNAGYEVHATWRSWDMPNEYDLALPFWTAAAATGKDAVGGLAKEGRTTFDRLGPPGRTYSVLAKTL